jgi:hypothetical protein
LLGEGQECGAQMSITHLKLHVNIQKYVNTNNDQLFQEDEIKQEISRAKEVKEDWLRRATRAKRVEAAALSTIAKLVTQCKEKKKMPTDKTDGGDPSKPNLQQVVKENATKTLSIIGLRLEHMLVVMEKQKLTNPFILRNRKQIPPHMFMGIDYRIYNGPMPDEQITQFALERGVFDGTSQANQNGSAALKQIKQQEVQQQIGAVNTFY